MTTDEYLRGEEVLTPQELVWGVVRDAPSPHPRHQRAVVSLTVALIGHVRAHGLGEVFVSPLDVVLDRERGLVVQPDLFFFSKDRAHVVTDRVWGAPDLVVEVLSPNVRIGNLGQRLEWFAAYGVRECWLVHQLAREVEIVRFDEGREISRRRFGNTEPITSAVLPAFTLTLADLLPISG
jgi:Uma2 family endonuclease